MRALDALILEAGRRLAGSVTIPAALGAVGVAVSFEQGAKASALLFVGGYLWTYGYLTVSEKVKRRYREWRSSKES